MTIPINYRFQGDLAACQKSRGFVKGAIPVIRATNANNYPVYSQSMQIPGGGILLYHRVHDQEYVTVSMPYNAQPREEEKGNKEYDLFCAFNTEDYGGVWDLESEDQIPYNPEPPPGNSGSNEEVSTQYVNILKSYSWNTKTKLDEVTGETIPLHTMSIFHVKSAYIYSAGWHAPFERVYLYIDGNSKASIGGSIATNFYIYPDNSVALFALNAKYRTEYPFVHRYFELHFISLDSNGTEVSNNKYYSAEFDWGYHYCGETMAFDGSTMYISRMQELPNISSFVNYSIPFPLAPFTCLLSDTYIYDFDPVARDVVSRTRNKMVRTVVTVPEQACPDPPPGGGPASHEYNLGTITSAISFTVLNGTAFSGSGSANDFYLQCSWTEGGSQWDRIYYFGPNEAYYRTNNVLLYCPALVSTYDFVNSKWVYYDYLIMWDGPCDAVNPCGYVGYNIDEARIYLLNQDGSVFTDTVTSPSEHAGFASSGGVFPTGFEIDCDFDIETPIRGGSFDDDPSWDTWELELPSWALPDFKLVYSLGGYHQDTDRSKLLTYSQTYHNLNGTVTYTAKRDLQDGKGLQDSGILQVERRWVSNGKTLKLKRIRPEA